MYIYIYIYIGFWRRLHLHPEDPDGGLLKGGLLIRPFSREWKEMPLQPYRSKKNLEIWTPLDETPLGSLRLCLVAPQSESSCTPFFLSDLNISVHTTYYKRNVVHTTTILSMNEFILGIWLFDDRKQLSLSATDSAPLSRIFLSASGRRGHVRPPVCPILPTKIAPTKIARLELSGRFPMGRGIPPLKSRFCSI